MTPNSQPFATLNETFYRASPPAYFEQRLFMLMATADKMIDLSEFIRKGMQFGPISVGPVADYASTDDERAHQEQFLTTESIALLHHVSETLLRLYFAHASLVPVPWLALVAERNPNAFKDRVRRRFLEVSADSPEEEAELATVFFGAPGRAALSPEPAQDAYEEGLRNIARWMRFFAREFIRNANLYNSVKHGVAIQPGRSQLAVSIDGVEEPFLSAQGTSVTFVEQKAMGGRDAWHLTTVWLEPSHLTAAASVGIKLMYQLWNLGCTRYSDADPPGLKLFENLDFEKFAAATEPPGVQTLSFELRDEPKRGPRERPRS